MAKQSAPQQAKAKAVKKKAKEEAIKKRAKEEAIEKKAKEEAIEKLDSSSIVNPRTKKRIAPTHELSDRPRKARKRTPSPSSPHVGEGAENVDPSLHRTPTTKRIASYTSLSETETKILAPDMETQIAAEARGVTRKNIPWDIFHSRYLGGFSTKDEPILTVESVMEIGKGDWVEKSFWRRLCQILSDEVRCSGCAFIYLLVLC